MLCILKRTNNLKTPNDLHPFTLNVWFWQMPFLERIKIFFFSSVQGSPQQISITNKWSEFETVRYVIYVIPLNNYAHRLKIVFSTWNVLEKANYYQMMNGMLMLMPMEILRLMNGSSEMNNRIKLMCYHKIGSSWTLRWSRKWNACTVASSSFPSPQ